MPVIMTSSLPGLSCISMKLDPHHRRIKRVRSRVVRIVMMLCLMRSHPWTYSPVRRSMSIRCSVACVGMVLAPLVGARRRGVLHDGSAGSRSDVHDRLSHGSGFCGFGVREMLLLVLGFRVRHGHG